MLYIVYTIPNRVYSISEPVYLRTAARGAGSALTLLPLSQLQQGELFVRETGGQEEQWQEKEEHPGLAQPGRHTAGR